MEKSEAKSLGLSKFNTGRPCKRGHKSDRWTSTGMCCECLNERNVRTYWENPEAAREKAKAKYKPEYASEYYKKNKERISANNKAWLATNQEKKAQIDADYRLREAEKVAAANAKWARENPCKRMASWRNRQAREKKAEGTHTADDVSAIYARQNGLCVYCYVDLSSGYHVDHIMPLALGGSNWPSNLQCLCPTCNIRKGAKHPDDWHNEIGWLVAA